MQVLPWEREKHRILFIEWIIESVSKLHNKWIIRRCWRWIVENGVFHFSGSSTSNVLRCADSKLSPGIHGGRCVSVCDHAKPTTRTKNKIDLIECKRDIDNEIGNTFSLVCTFTSQHTATTCYAYIFDGMLFTLLTCLLCCEIAWSEILRALVRCHTSLNRKDTKCISIGIPSNFQQIPFSSKFVWKKKTAQSNAMTSNFQHVCIFKWLTNSHSPQTCKSIN